MSSVDDMRRLRKTWMHRPINVLVVVSGLLAQFPQNALAAPMIDGTVMPTEGYSLLAVQTHNSSAANDTFELNSLHAQLTNTDLYLGIPQNLGGGLATVVFLDTDSNQGVATLNIPSTSSFLAGQNGLAFDNGFLPDWALIVTSGAASSPANTFYDLLDLNTVAPSTFLGMDLLNDGLSTGITGGAAAFDNTNTAGVSVPATLPGTGGATATTGLEVQLNASLLFGVGGQFNDEVCLMVVQTDTGSTYLNNQVLPAGLVPGPLPALGWGPAGIPGAVTTDFNNYAGDQFVCINNVPEPSSLILLCIGLGVFGFRFARRRISSSR